MKIILTNCKPIVHEAILISCKPQTHYSDYVKLGNTNCYYIPNRNNNHRNIRQ